MHRLRRVRGGMSRRRLLRGGPAPRRMGELRRPQRAVLQERVLAGRPPTDAAAPGGAAVMQARYVEGVGPALAHLELTLLCVLTLCLALIPGLPVPRVWAAVSAALVAAQTAAVRTMRLEPFEPAVRSSFEPLDTRAE